MPTVACLLTDFGNRDNYVGVMKGVILSVCPETKIVDLTHEIPPQDIQTGAYQLLASHAHFPKETLFVGVVDPGVGSKRKIIYAEAGDWRFIGPDNGLFSWIFNKHKPHTIYEIDGTKVNEKGISQTFHGRDIMAPLAGRLLKGEKPSQFGKEINDWEKIPVPSLKKSGSRWEGEVMAADIYGNLITNFPSHDVLPYAESSTLWVEWPNQPSTIRGLVKAYTDVEKGKPLAIAGSAGFIELSVRDGNAKQTLGLTIGDRLCLNFRT